MRVRAGIALLLIVVAAGAVNYFRPIPAVAATHLLKTSEVIPGTTPALPWPTSGSGALGVSGLGLVATSGNEQAIPAASVAKVMTAMIVLEDSKLKKGDDGPNLTMTDADVRAYEADLQDKQSVVKVESGEKLSLFQVLEAVLIPSANNLAETVARWDAGSIDAFVTKMNSRAAGLHLAHTKFADPSGASPSSVSTPTDLVMLGMLAMQNDVFAQIVARGQVTLPVAGTVYNVDAALGQNGIIGIKTGSGLNTGANFLFAANATVDNTTIVIYGCVMGQPTLESAFAKAKALLAAMTPALHVKKVLAQNQSVANYTTPWGEQTDLVSAVDVNLAEWPGMVLRQGLAANSIVLDRPVAPRTQEGTEHIVLGDYSLDVPLVTADQLYPPGRLWRLTRISF
ncbi:MAG TPA: serine hydrolase [Candidatus Dormibacteraeota bacterium]|nr:serine hydrolase [Candidatus Dormibacteraeota bacterium]